MDFGNFGFVSYTTAAKVSAFVDRLAEGKFMTTKCRECGKVFYPPQVDCPVCLTADMQWIEISSKGRLLSYTTAHYGPAGFDDKVPYTLGIVEFPEGIKVLAPISREVTTESIKVGSEFRVIPTNFGQNRVGFELVKDSETSNT